MARVYNSLSKAFEYLIKVKSLMSASFDEIYTHVVIPRSSSLNVIVSHIKKTSNNRTLREFCLSVFWCTSGGFTEFTWVFLYNNYKR